MKIRHNGRIENLDQTSEKGRTLVDLALRNGIIRTHIEQVQNEPMVMPLCNYKGQAKFEFEGRPYLALGYSGSYATNEDGYIMFIVDPHVEC